MPTRKRIALIACAGVATAVLATLPLCLHLVDQGADCFGELEDVALEMIRELPVQGQSNPELNPVERVWLHLRERFLSHRVLDGYDAILDACCEAWNALTPERLRSLTAYPWIQKITS